MFMFRNRKRKRGKRYDEEEEYDSLDDEDDEIFDEDILKKPRKSARISTRIKRTNSIVEEKDEENEELNSTQEEDAPPSDEKSRQQIRRTKSVVSLLSEKQLVHTLKEVELNLGPGLLPKEIVVKIFRYLTHLDRSNIKPVCRNWDALINNEPELAWRAISVNYTSILHKKALYSYDNEKVADLTNISYSPPLRFQKIHNNDYFTTPIVVTDSDKKLMGYIHPFNWFKHIPEVQDCGDLWEIETWISEKKDEYSDPILHLHCYVNVARLSYLVANNLEIVGKSIILDRVKDEQAKSNSKVKIPDITKPHTPMKLETPEQQPDGLNVSLYRYQLDAISWMKRAELCRWVNYTPLYAWRGSPLLFDTKNETILTVPSDEAFKRVYKFFPTGGILGDEMGLGKTLEVIGLILARPAKPESIVDDGGILATKATLIFCPLNLVKQWKDEIVNRTTITTTKPQTTETTAESTTEEDDNSSKKKKRKRSKSNSSKSEKSPEPTTTTTSLNVITISTLADWRRCSYQDIKDADVVIVSAMFTTNNEYPNSTTNSWLQKKIKVSPLSSLTCPQLEFFKWHRIVLDEGHQFITLSILEKLKSRYRWYVTGTPFSVKYLAISPISKFLQFPSSDPSQQFTKYNDNTLSALNDIVVNNFYWRNTKESTKNYLEIPSCVESVILLDFHPVEKSLYDDADTWDDTEKKLRLCSLAHTMIISNTGGSSLLDIPDIMLKKRKKELVQNKAFLEKSISGLNTQKRKLADAQIKFDNATADMKERPNGFENLPKDAQQKILSEKKTNLYIARHAFESCECLVSAAEDQVKDSKERIECCNSSIQIFEEIIEQLKKQPREKPKKQPQNKLVLSEMRVADLKSELQKRKLDTSGNKPNLLERLTVALQKEAESENNSNANEEDITNMILYHGTKTAHLVRYLKDILKTQNDARVIVFSRFNVLLHQISKILQENHIYNVTVEGTAHNRNAAIEQFKDHVRVMMLNVETAGTGINLIEATHVILMDPMVGKEARAIEAQAIGRAWRQGQKKKVTVVRFIISNTDEHALYLKNNLCTDEEQRGEQDANDTIELSSSNTGLIRTGSFSTLLVNSFDIPRHLKGETTTTTTTMTMADMTTSSSSTNLEMTSSTNLEMTSSTNLEMTSSTNLEMASSTTTSTSTNLVTTSSTNLEMASTNMSDTTTSPPIISSNSTAISDTSDTTKTASADLAMVDDEEPKKVTEVQPNKDTEVHLPVTQILDTPSTTTMDTTDV